MNQLNSIVLVQEKCYPPDKKAEDLHKKVKTANAVLTGVGAAGITGAALTAGALAKEANKYPDALVGRTGKAVIAPFKYVNKKAVNPIAGKLSKFFADHKLGKSLATIADYAFKKPAKYVYEKAAKLPKGVKIAAGVSAGLLAVSHFYRSGLIDGAIPSKKNNTTTYYK